MKKEISWQQLRNSYEPSDFSFETTEQIVGEDKMLGQDEAVDALKFALNLNHSSYNIYIATNATENVLADIKKLIQRRAIKQVVPDDICYIYNFDNPNSPRVIYLDAGDGATLEEDMKEFVYFIKYFLVDKLQDNDISLEKEQLEKDLELNKLFLLDELQSKANKLGFEVSIVEEGLAFSPLEGVGEEILTNNIKSVTILAEEVVNQIKQVEDKAAIQLQNILEEKFSTQVSLVLNKLKIKYRHYPEFLDYFDDILEDIVKYYDLFIEQPTDNTELELILKMSTKKVDDILKNYSVNLLVDNQNTLGAPIIDTRNVSYSDLVGQILMSPEGETDICEIRAGEFHRARGGYLILRAIDIIEQVGAYQAIRQTLIEGAIKIQNPSTGSVNRVKLIEPEEVDMDLKIIIIGDAEYYNLLNSYEDGFNKYFGYKIELLEEVNYTKRIVEQIGYKIKQQCIKENLKPVTCGGLLSAIRKTQVRMDKVSLNIEPIYNMIREANTIANKYITANDIDNAIRFKKTLTNKIDNEMKDNYRLDRILINVKGSKIGQINGLCVYGIGDETIGQPIKITATTYKGKKGVINVEKLAGLSGSTHSKGVEVIEGFIGGRFARNIEPNLSCKICMEQSYSGIDGDSASSAELYAVISSLSGIPIKQNLAITGSINQHGDIQPVGGLSEKIEGFFKACKAKGLTNEQGVVIPYQNQVDLVLSDEIVQNIREGKFHIYPISRYEQGIEILMEENIRIVEKKVLETLSNMSKK
ncbi:MAG: hypothetical protein BEN19_01675 [Epulopiscium sp. Nuni2H_MBin003]|nr:MAG: hypothetical protein BEN19_01675 [Epulopiscium sp. Nuni2H_MBin003]